jgi:hypothetical protein
MAADFMANGLAYMIGVPAVTAIVPAGGVVNIYSLSIAVATGRTIVSDLF